MNITAKELERIVADLVEKAERGELSKDKSEMLKALIKEVESRNEG